MKLKLQRALKLSLLKKRLKPLKRPFRPSVLVKQRPKVKPVVPNHPKFKKDDACVLVFYFMVILVTVAPFAVVRRPNTP